MILGLIGNGSNTETEHLHGMNSAEDPIWIPTFHYKNLIEKISVGDEGAEVFLQTVNGVVEVSHTSHAIIKTSCHMDFQNFPFDSQKCEFAFGSDTASSTFLVFETYIHEVSTLKHYEEFDVHLTKVVKDIGLK